MERRRTGLTLAPTMLATAFALLASPASAFDLSGTKRIALQTRDGTTIDIGTVTFEPTPAGATFAVDIDPSKFKTFFLSMRDFKCLEGPEIECYVPYPYKTPGTITAKDLSWLSHSLLFFYKNPAAYGANLADGLFYDLKITDKGIEGAPQAIDLNAIASPPADLTVPPYDKDARSDIEPGARWIAKLIIADPAP